MESHMAANHLGEWNTILRGAKNWWDSPRGTVIRMEALVLFVAIIMVFLAICGSRRRRGANLVSRNLVRVAYWSIPLISYTLGSMQSSTVKSNMYPFWAVSLYVLSVSTDAITAYSLDDNSQGTERIYQAFLVFIYVVWIAVPILIINPVVATPLFVMMILLSFGKWGLREMACDMASGGLSYFLDKVVADYMRQEHKKSGPSYYPTTMKGYHYLVDWSLSKSSLKSGTLYGMRLRRGADVIDIEKIWQCESLSSEQRDVCLSFSLFHLLRRRFFGFACAESRQQKTHDFVFKGLLAKNESGTIDYDRAFKVIDVELAFMYDFFFTKHAVAYYKKWVAMAYASFYVIVLVVLLATMAVNHSPLTRHLHVRNWSHVATTTTIDIAFTILMLTCIGLLELRQPLHYWTTIWGTLHLACHPIRRQQALRKRGGELGRIDMEVAIGSFISSKYFYWFPDQRNKCYWQNKLGQYSLLESVDIPFKALRAYFKHGKKSFACLLEACWETYRLRWCARKPGKPIELSAQVKEAVVQSLERTQGVLTNGQSSLMSNGATGLLWACSHPDLGTNFLQQNKKNQAHIILTWHIATCYCEMAYPCPGAEGDLKRHLQVATKLSKYCAYLVVSRPKLLPGHHCDTELVFHTVIEEAIEFRKSKTGETLEPNEEIFNRSVRLGKQLEAMEQGARWKVLADFWAEMLLYLAPSDNVKEHVECLAKGGEFITHLWALLSHAGILEVDQRTAVSHDMEN